MRHRLSLLFALPLLACLHAETSAPVPEPDPKADPAYTWDIAPLYRDGKAFDAAKAKFLAELPGLARYRGRLGESAATLREAMELLTNLKEQYYRLAIYAMLASDVDTRNAAALERNQGMDMAGAEFSSVSSFVDPELLAVGEAKLRTYLDAEPGLAAYRFPILATLRRAPHTLGDEAESVLSSVGMIADAPSSLHSILSNADIPWPTIKLSDGTEVRLDQSGFSRARMSSNRADRQAAFEAFWPKVKEYERTFGVALFSQVKTDWFGARMRKYPNSLAAALAGNDIPEAVYRTMLAEANASLPTLHRYYRLRGRMLGIKELRYWDLYPPLVKLDKPFTYEQAKGHVLEAVRPLGAEYGAALAACLNGRNTHVYPQQGKRSGAYQIGDVRDVTPYVLLNYNDDYESVSTVAHEWGHGMHSYLANRSQPAPLAEYSTFTAEIASTLNESLLVEHMVAVAADDDERLYYLGSALEELRAAFYHQAMFAEFELRIHEEVEKGNALSGETFTRIYAELVRRYQGDAEGVVKVDDDVTVGWAMVPHFYRDFYVYQYATSIAAAQAFADRILRGEPGAIETYLGLLKAGGSAHPYELVKGAGVDLATPEPYRALVKHMNGIMDRMEEILARRGK